jgi:Putative auto-transporter adhesin, head GIN domain
MPSPRLALLLLPALALGGCAVGDDGPRTSQTRDVEPFTRVDNRGSVDVRLRVGEPQRVRVLAGEKVIDDVRTEVRDGTMRVTFDHDGFGGSNVVVEAAVPKLTGVVVDGSGNVEATGVDGDALDVVSDGSGDVMLEGTVERLAVDVDGSGDADLAALAAREAHVFVGGSGEADVRAAERLAVEVDGSGDVRYYGDPAVTQQIDGSGELSRGRG